VAKVLAQATALALPRINAHQRKNPLLKEAAPLAAAHGIDSAIRANKPNFNLIVRGLGQNQLHFYSPVRKFIPEGYNQLAVRIAQRILNDENARSG
jgi:hypothetical protein